MHYGPQSSASRVVPVILFLLWEIADLEIHQTKPASGKRRTGKCHRNFILKPPSHNQLSLPVSFLNMKLSPHAQGLKVGHEKKRQLVVWQFYSGHEPELAVTHRKSHR